MESILSGNVETNHDKAFYNLRKRYGSEQARRVFRFWYHFHIEEPANADEALYFFILGGDF